VDCGLCSTYSNSPLMGDGRAVAVAAAAGCCFSAAAAAGGVPA